MRLLFASMHGSAAMELATLCRGANIELSILMKGNGVISAATLPCDTQMIEGLNANCIADKTEILDKISNGYFDALIVSAPHQVAEYNKSDFKHLKLIVRHGLNSFEKFRAGGVKNFISPCRRAGAIMGVNFFHNRKLIPWDKFPAADTDASQRSGFASYIHYYQKHWPKAKQRFDELQLKVAPLKIQHYGYEGEQGRIDDISKMKISKATIHIKDGQVCCNAVIRSLAMSTPVLMDEETKLKCFFDDIKGIEIFNTLDDVARRIKEINEMREDELNDLCDSVYANARKHLSYDDELGTRFTYFLENLT